MERQNHRTDLSSYVQLPSRSNRLKIMEKFTLTDLISLSRESDNIIITKWLKQLEKIIREESNDMLLGAILRKTL